MVYFLVQICQLPKKKKCFLETIVIIIVHCNSIVVVTANDPQREVHLFPLQLKEPSFTSVTCQGNKRKIGVAPESSTTSTLS